MRILVIGGGPAGLYFSYLLKKHRPEHRIEVVEQNPEGATYGWGVVFSGVALDAIRAADEAFYEDFIRDQEACEYIEVVHRGQGVQIHGNHFSRTPRLQLLARLEAACRRVGVPLHHRTHVDVDAAGAEYDLVVCADGINSASRARHAEAFGTTVQTRRNHFAWYGTTALFHPLSLIFVPTRWGTFISHCYQFSKTHSTFLVECSPETWRAAGLDTLPEDEGRALCEQIFAAELDGEPLLSNRSTWFQAHIVSNAHASHGRTVLIGDAYRTVHFSLGSGTRMAMQDAVALSQAIGACGNDATAALEAFERSRRPASNEFQEAASRSLDWYEDVDRRLHLSPIEFAYDYMTRTGKVTREDLRKMDPAFVAAYEAAIGNAAPGAAR